MRPIDADRLLEPKRIETYYHLKNGDIAIPLIDIRHAPTIEERKRGRWTFVDGFTKCSECGYRPKLSSGWNFCPHCGADMRGNENG